MRVSNLFVILKSSSATDSMGGDLPLQSYVYFSGVMDGLQSFTHDLQDAEIYDSKYDASEDMSKIVSPYFRVETLERAIKFENVKAADLRELSL